MSSIKTTQIDGDVSIGRNLSMGGKANIQGSVHVGHNMRVDGWLEAPNIKGANKGIYLTVEELRSAYPNPHDGWLAGVGASTPFTAYVGKGGDWVASGGQIEINVDLSQYTEEVEQLRQDIIAVNGGLGSANAEIAELLKRIKGESENSSAYTDPFIYIGNFDGWDALNKKLKKLDDPNLINYMGRCRAKVSGVTIELYNFINNFSKKDYSQVILGNVSANSNGDVTFTSDHFNIMHRQHKDGAWSAWQRINDHPLATPSLDGLMSADDKKALDSVDSAFKNLGEMNFYEASEYCATFDNIIEKLDGGAIRFSKPTIFTFSGGGSNQGMIINSPSSGGLITQFAFLKASTNGGFSRRIIQYNPYNLTITNVGEWRPISDLIPAATTSAAGLMSADDKEKSDNYPAQFVMDFGLVDSQTVGEQMAARSEVAGNRNISFIRFQVNDDGALRTTLILQCPNGDDYTAQIKFTDKTEWRRNVRGATGVAGAATAATQWERTAPHYLGYDAATRKIQLKDYTQAVSGYVELPLATSSQPGLMSAADKEKSDNYPAQFVLDLGDMPTQAEGEARAASSEVAGNRNISFIRFQTKGVRAKKTTLILQWPNGDNYTAQIKFTDKAEWRRNVRDATGVAGAATAATPWERTAPHYIGYDAANRRIQFKDYTQEVSRFVELPLATSSQHGLMSAKDKEKMDKYPDDPSELSFGSGAQPWTDVVWSGHNMNEFTDSGEYYLHGYRTDDSDNLPIRNVGGGHSIDARLTVLDSSLPNLPNNPSKNTDACVTQVLRMSNRTGGDGHVFVRTAQGTDKDNLAWGTWEKLMGIFEKNQVFNLDDLDGYTTNGMYSGIYAGTEPKNFYLARFLPGDTFLMITVNGYAVSNFGMTPQITQLLYKLPAKTSTSEQNAEIYLRTGSYNKTDKVWVWRTFSKMVTNADLLEIPVATDSNNGLMSAYHVELIEQLFEKAGQYADRFVDNPRADSGNISGKPSAGLMSAADKAKLENYPNSPFDIAPATEDSPGLMSAADKARSDNYPTQFVMDFGLVDSQAAGEQMAARSEVAGNRNISFIRFQVNGVRALRTSLILQWPNGINETAQLIFTDKAQFRRNVTGATGVAGAATTATDWERTAPHCIGYDAARRMIQLKDYTQTTWKRGEVELPLATSSQHGLMSSADKAKITELESRIYALEVQLSSAAQ